MRNWRNDCSEHRSNHIDAQYANFRDGGLDGIRDKGLLDSAVNAPFQTFGEELYRSTEAKAARLGFSLIKNHPFIDGNKRIGILAMITFLELNGISIDYTDDNLIEIGLDLAAGKMAYEQLLVWIIDHAIE